MEKDMEMKGKVRLYGDLHDYLSQFLLALVAKATARGKHLNSIVRSLVQKWHLLCLRWNPTQQYGL